MNAFLFDLSFYVAAPFWALMIFAPGWLWTARIVGSPFIVVPPVLVYAVLVLPEIGTFLAAVARPSLEGVQDLLASPAGTAAAWAHLIAFDLFVGRWIYLDSRSGERRMHPLVMAPILVCTILLAPVGFLAYAGMRAVRRSAVPRT